MSDSKLTVIDKEDICSSEQTSDSTEHLNSTSSSPSLSSKENHCEQNKDFDFQTEEEQEDPEEYCKGGYHYVKIGESLCDGRYLVIRKIGWGTFSTVWLCLDQYLNKYVAIKIVKSDKMITDSAVDEIKMLRIIENYSHIKDPFRNKVVKLLSHFKIRGINGYRKCLGFLRHHYNRI